jgi:hypothetical protein
MARANAPKDFLTKLAIVLTKVLISPTLFLTPIQIFTTSIGGCLIGLTFGAIAFVLSIIWWPFMILLLGSSWIWLRSWYSRPILLFPGVLIALISHIYIMLAPDPEKDAKYTKLSMADEWPLSWYLLRPPSTPSIMKLG